MTRDENIVIESRRLLYSGEPSERSIAVASLMNEELDDETIKILCSLVEDGDSGVRNAVDMTLSYNLSLQIPKYLVNYISFPRIATRNLAGDILLKIGSRAVKSILEYIDSGNDDDKKFLVDILGLIGDKKSSQYILDLMKSSRNDNVVLACIEALGSLGYDESIDTMFQYYERNELYKPTIVEALGKIGTKIALDFITLKYSEEDELTKFSIIESLGNIGNEDSFFFLISELGEAIGPIIWPIIDSIDKLKVKYNLDIPFDDKMKKAILQTVDCPDKKYRISAVRLLVVFDDEETVKTCIKIYGENLELDEIIRPKIFFQPHIFFSEFPGIVNRKGENIRSLMELLKKFSEEDNKIFGNMISNIQLRNLTDALTKCLDNPDEEVRRLSVELLFIYNQSTALLFTEKMAEDDNMWNKLKLLEILNEINLPDVNSVLIKMTTDTEEMVNEKAKSILSQKLTLNLEKKPERK